MNELGVMLVWCALQVTLTVTVALALSHLLGRWFPRASRTVATTGTLLVLLLSILAWSPWPRWASMTAESSLAPLTAPDSSHNESTLTAPQPGSDNDPSLQEKGSTVHKPSTGQSFAQAFFESLRQLPARQNSGWSWPAILALIFLLLALVGAMHLAFGLIAVHRMRKRGRPLRDTAVLDMVHELRTSMKLRTEVEVVESDELAIAATVGWLHPAILLSPDWSRWTREELRLVLAHELAHIQNNDFLCFVCAKAGLALHLYHPLVHWLVARLQLDLELAADASAVATVGDPTRYLHALADMALRQSDRRLGWSARTFLPTRGTFLRRLEMLKNSSTLRWQGAPGIRLLAGGLLLVTGIVAAGLRGAVGADPPANQAAPRPAGAAMNASDWIPADVMAVAIIRPADLAGQTNLGTLTNLLLSDVLRKFALTPDKVEQLTLLLLPPQEQGRPPREGGYILRLKAAEKITPIAPTGAAESTKEFMGKTYLTSGREAWAQIDPQTLLVAPEEELKLMIASGREGKSPLVKSKAWQTVGGQPVVVAVDMRVVSKALNLADASPAAQALLAPLWSETAEFYLAGDVAGGLKFSGLIQGREGAGLQKTKDTLTAAQTLGQNMLTGLRTQLSRQPADDRALIGTFLDIADELLQAVKIEEQAGNSLSVNTAVQFNQERSASLQQAVVQVRKAAQRAQGMNNLKQLALALHNYNATQGHFPPAVLMGKDNQGGVPHSWRVAILPYLEAQHLYEQYKFDEPWDSESNRKVLAQMPAVFRCAEDNSESVNASYFAVIGPGTVFSKPEGTKLDSITDGLSNTIALIEAKLDIPWTKPADIEISAGKPPPKLGGWCGDGYAVAFCDGAVRIFNKGIKEKHFRALLSIAGGEAIDPNDFDE